MPLQKDAVFNKVEYSYNSPDGDKYRLTVVDTGQSKYIEIKQIDQDSKEQDKRVYDLNMLFEVVDEIRKASSNRTVTAQTRRQRLAAPRLTDYRGASPSAVAQSTQAKVDASMQAYDESIKPVDSFSKQQTKEGENDEYDYEEDIRRRQTLTPTRYAPKGSSGQGFKRVDASELI